MTNTTSAAATAASDARLEKLIAALPKAELHLHIEGSLEPELLFALAQKNKVAIPYRSVEEVRAAYQFSNLQSFLDLYYQGMSVLLQEDDFAELAYAYMTRLHADHVVHAEPFFDPQGHTSRHVPFATVYKGLMKGFARGEADFGITIGLIFSFLRHTSEEECLELLQQDNAEGEYIRDLFAQKAFVAIGLDSAEVGNPPAKFERLYRYCRDVLGVPYAVAHAGEEGPPAYMEAALDVLQVSRIDHGVASIKDAALQERLVAAQTPLTVCPFSNVKLRVFKTRDACREVVLALARRGLCVTLNSDDPAYFGGYLNDNLRYICCHHYAAAAETGCMPGEESALAAEEEEGMETLLVQMVKNSIVASFLEEERKKKFLAEIDQIVAQ